METTITETLINLSAEWQEDSTGAEINEVMNQIDAKVCKPVPRRRIRRR